MNDVAVVTPPELTLPPDAAADVPAGYAAAGVALKYGLGGSMVFSAQSKETWLANMPAHFVIHQPNATVQQHPDDICGAMRRIEKLVKLVEMFGRMARLEIASMAVPIDRPAWVINTYLRPN